MEFCQNMSLQQSITWNISKIAEQCVPRYIFGKDGLDQLRNPPSLDELEIHTFVDGGNLGWGCSPYIRFPIEHHENYDSSLIQARSRMAPTKNQLSTPRKELNGGVLGIKTTTLLTKELGIPHNKCFIHMDSWICLFWITKPLEELKTYVSNKVKILQESKMNFIYTSSEENVADLLTKLDPFLLTWIMKSGSKVPHSLENRIISGKREEH